MHGEKVPNPAEIRLMMYEMETVATLPTIHLAEVLDWLKA